MGTVLNEKLNKFELAPFPQSVNSLLEAFRDPDSTISEFVSIVETDPPLVGRIIKTINSPFYGFTNEITSISHAVTMLGRSPLRTLALSYAFRTLLAGGTDSAELNEIVWSHSLGCGVVARLLAERSQIDPEEAFIAGLFHDIGKLFICKTSPKVYEKMINLCGETLLKKEEKAFGFTHPEAGFRLAVSWPIGEKLKFAIKAHGDAYNDSAHPEFVKAISLANDLAHHWGIGASFAKPDYEIDTELATEFALTEELLSSLRPIAEDRFAESFPCFS